MPDPSLTPAKPALPPVHESPVFNGPGRTERFGVVLGIDLGCADSGMVVSREVRMPRANMTARPASRRPPALRAITRHRSRVRTASLVTPGM